jgi:hypothetical protein
VVGYALRHVDAHIRVARYRLLTADGLPAPSADALPGPADLAV